MSKVITFHYAHLNMVNQTECLFFIYQNSIIMYFLESDQKLVSMQNGTLYYNTHNQSQHGNQISELFVKHVILQTQCFRIELKSWLHTALIKIILGHCYPAFEPLTKSNETMSTMTLSMIARFYWLQTMNQQMTVVYCRQCTASVSWLHKTPIN